MNRTKQALLYLGLALALLAPRLPALNSFSTLDEPYWLSMGANFYYALGQREFQNTIYEYQPAVTTMWIVTAAMMVYFPQYRGLGQGYLEYEKGALDPFMLEHGKDPLVLLQVARVIQVLLLVLLTLLVFYLLQKLLDRWIALFAVLFLSFEPFFLGQSRLLDHEAMLSLFIIISVLALAVYLFQERRPIYIILSGMSAGLAQLTKSSAIAILLPIGICILIFLWQNRHEDIAKTLLNATKVFVIWLALLVITYFVFWPGMWTAPGKMLYEVYGNAFSYAFQGARLKVTGDVEPSQFRVDTNFAGFVYLMKVILLRTTPLTWLGALLGLILPFTRDREQVRAKTRLVTILMFVTTLSFLLMFAFAQGRNSPHYILTSFGALSILAGLGWIQLVERLSGIFQWRNAARLVLAAILGVLIWSALAYYPYYFTYENLIYVRSSPSSFPQFAYGEGLEVAAQYLAQRPEAESSVALVYYARGSFSYFFPGETTRFKPYYVDAGHEQELLDALNGADYVVIYYAVQGYVDRYAELIDTLENITPEQEIWLNGYKYVVIYRVDSFPPAVFETLSQ